MVFPQTSTQTIEKPNAPGRGRWQVADDYRVLLTAIIAEFSSERKRLAGAPHPPGVSGGFLCPH